MYGRVTFPLRAGLAGLIFEHGVEDGLEQPHLVETRVHTVVVSRDDAEPGHCAILEQRWVPSFRALVRGGDWWIVAQVLSVRTEELVLDIRGKGSGGLEGLRLLRVFCDTG